jgi:hypothetical protein
MRRPPLLPAPVRERLGLTETPLSTAMLPDDGWAVATRSGLHVLVGQTATSRRWTDVDGASLDGETGHLTVRFVDGTPPLVLELDDRTHLPRTVHDRVQSSVVLTETVSVPGDTHVRVTLRRDADGRLFTQVVGNGRVDLTNPAVAAAVDAAEARVREAAGLSAPSPEGAERDSPGARIPPGIG